MRTLLLILALIFVNPAAYSQYKISANGMLERGTGTQTDTSIVRNLVVRDNESAKKTFLKELLKRVETTFDNLQDDSLGLRDQYGAFYCDAFFCSFYQDMRTVRDLLRRNIIDTTSPFFPGFQIKHWLDTTKVFDISIQKRNYKVNVIKPFNDFIYKLYRDEAYSDIQGWGLDMEYKNAWRQMEFYYKQGKFWLDSLSQANGTITTCRLMPQIDSFISRMNRVMADSCNNPIPGSPDCNIYPDKSQIIIPLLYRIKDAQGIKKWLWYSGGIISMNPLVYTTQNRRYPASEKWTVVDSASVNASRKLDTDSAFKDFFTTEKLLNDIQLASSSTQNKHKQLLEFYDNDTAAYSNNINRYFDKNFSNILTHRDSMKVYVYNVAADTKFSMSHEFKNIPETGAVTAQLNSAFDAFPLTVVGTTIGANLSGILNNINTKNKQIPPIFIPPANQQNLASLVGKNIYGGTVTELKSGLNLTDSTKSLTTFGVKTYTFFKTIDTKTFLNGPDDQAVKDLDFLVIQDQRVIFKKDQDYNLDKRNIITATLTFRNKDCQICTDTTAHYIIDSFIVKDYCTTLDYSPKKMLLSIDAMMKRFFTFLSCVDSCKERTTRRIGNLVTIQKYLSKFMIIANRSLPPDTSGLTPFKYEKPLYVTYFLNDGLLDSSSQHTIKITKVSKINDKDSAFVVKQIKFKTGKIFYIDASAGLGLTVTDYTVPESQASGLPTTKSGDKLQLTAGINIYPFGYLKVDNRILPSKPYGAIHRLSLYLGVSVSSKPLDNIYTGISYDIVPGIKTIVGGHWFKNTRYQIVNNQVFNQADGYKPTLFFGLNIEPVTFIKALGIIK